MGLDPARSTNEALLPAVTAERCVHSLLEQASCRSCVEACPTGAWVIDDEAVGIDPALCDGCGLCVPACPQGVLDQPVTPAYYRIDGIRIAFAVCAKAGRLDSTEGIVPCLHTFGLDKLLRLYGQGVRRLVLGSGNCDSCPRGTAPRIAHYVQQANWLLEARGRATLAVDRIEVEGWQQARTKAAAGDDNLALGRRAFFRRALDGAAQKAVGQDRSAERETPGFSPAGRLLPRTEATQPCVHVPHIEARRCAGCDVCARTCPHAAITLELDKTGGASYRLDPDRCSDCGLCRDVCASGAVEIRHFAIPEQEKISLGTQRCRACGVPFHRPLGSENANSMCTVCAQQNHYRNLFQTLD